MRRLLLLLVLCAPMASAQVPHPLPQGALGLLQVASLTRGELLWMQGRVGEGIYTTVDKEGRHCSIRMPVAVGKVARSGVGVEASDGLTIIVMTAALNDALLKGERVAHDAFRFAFGTGESAADGVIVNGIAADEGFVLNARRRWISWLLDNKPEPSCQ